MKSISQERLSYLINTSFFNIYSILLAPDKEDLPVEFWKIQLFNGTAQKYATYGGEHLLQ